MFAKGIARLCAAMSLAMLFPLHLIAQDTLYVDDTDGPPAYEDFGLWTTVNSIYGYRGTYRIITGINTQGFGQYAKWTPEITVPDYYAVYFYLPRVGSGRDNALYVVNTGAAEPDSFHLDQNYYQCAADTAYLRYSWNILGIYYLTAGTDNWVMVYHDSLSMVGYSFYADATRFVCCPDHQKIELSRRHLYSYGEANVGGGKDWSLRVWNIGKTQLTVTRISSESGIFLPVGESFPLTIAPQSYEDVTIRFAPNFERIFDDTLEVESDDPIEPVVRIPLRGVGTRVTVIVNNDDYTSGTYYREHVGTWHTSDSKAIVEGLTNVLSRYAWNTDVGARAEFIPDIPASGLYNVYMAVPGTQNANTHALYEVWPFGSAVDSVYLDQNNSGYTQAEWKYIGTYYFPQGMLSSVFVVNDGTGGGSVTRTDLMKFVSVSSVQDIEVPITSHRFYDVSVNQAATWDFVIHNLGEVPLTIHEMSTRTPQFSVASPSSFPVQIPELDSLTVTVRFIPSAIDFFADTLTIRTDDIDEPEVYVYLSGNGIGATVIVDDTDSLSVQFGPEGAWRRSSSSFGVNESSWYCYLMHHPGAYFQWNFTVPKSAWYEVYVGLIPTQNASAAAPYEIQPLGVAPDTVIIDQNGATLSNPWRYLGRFYFIEGPGSYIRLFNDTTITNLNAEGLRTTPEDSIVLRADAVKITESADQTSGVAGTGQGVPTQFELAQNYPNPFNQSTRIEYSVPVRSRVQIRVFNLLGQPVRTLVEGLKSAGRHSITWDGRDDNGVMLPSGVYVVRMDAESFRSSKKMVLLR